jgi:hypothetical protein
MALPKEIQEKVMVDAETNVSETDMKEDSMDRRPLDNGDVRCKFITNISLILEPFFKLNFMKNCKISISVSHS